MQVTIIGAGNMGTVLGRLLLANGDTVRQVYSRTPAHALLLAEELGAVAVSDTAMIDQEADTYLLTITDDALPAVAAKLSLGNKLVIHTAGSVSKQVLGNASTRYGVLWPVKMIRKNMHTIEPVTIVTDGNTEATMEVVEAFARRFSQAVTRADDATRAKMHMLAAVVSNFPNHLYRLAADYCEQEQIDFRFLYPIIEETARQVQGAHPASVQAGPAFRGDTGTMEKHTALLSGYPQLEALYGAISRSILRSGGA